MTASYIPAQRLAAAPEPFGLTLTPEPWVARAACATVSPEPFFAEGKGGSQYRDARKICDGCDVVAECLAYALLHNEREGFWGGKSDLERRAMRRKALKR